MPKTFYYKEDIAQINPNLLCVKCGGTGTLGPSDPCFSCVEQGICPKCGKLAWETSSDWYDSGYKCHFCGWQLEG